MEGLVGARRAGLHGTRLLSPSLTCPPSLTRPPRPEPLLGTVARLVRDQMEDAAVVSTLRVPLRVRLAAGPSWGQLEELTLPPSQRDA